MASFVLIHGAWHGGWSFDAIIPALRAAGHSVIAPDLPGIGGSDAALAAITLAGWADFTADLCRDAADPVILCGHSRGGLVISQAAEVAPEAIATLVYIAGMLLPSGLTRAEWKQQQQPNPAFDAIIHPAGAGTVIDPVGAPAVFAQLAPPEVARAAAARLVPEPASVRTTPLALTPARYGRVPRIYIECLQDRTIPIADQRAMQALQPCAQVYALDADHSPFLSTPDALVAALLDIARGVSA